jgi:hypothetical protein
VHNDCSSSGSGSLSSNSGSFATRQLRRAHEQQCWPQLQQQQQHQQQPPQLLQQQHPTLNSSIYRSAWSLHSTRGFASDSSSSGLGRRRRQPGFSSSSSNPRQQQQQWQPRGGDSSGLRVPVRSVVGQLGRRPEWFRPTELLGEYDLHDLDPQHDPFKDRRREVMQPRQVGGCFC